MKFFKKAKEDKKWDFESYSNTNKVRGSAEINIYKNGAFNLRSTFFKLAGNEIRDCKYAKLFYDKESKSIGIKFSNIEGIKMSETSKTTRSFSGRSFFSHYGLYIPMITGNYVANKEYINEEIGYLWVISLKDEEEINDH